MGAGTGKTARIAALPVWHCDALPVLSTSGVAYPWHVQPLTVTGAPPPLPCTCPALILAARGDTDAFTAPAEVAVQVTDFAGNTSCVLELHDAATGALLDAATAKPGAGSTQLLHPGSATKTYLYPDYCGVRISAAR